MATLQAEGASDTASAGAPPLSRWALAQTCCGLFGVQIVWALQNVDTSRIFQTLGANADDLPILWIAAPITGLLVQPIIGHLSDRTWSPLGRRRPYILGGALLSALALVLMPEARSVWGACAMLWLLTGSINLAMEPFRALVADTVPERQRTAAFAMQVGFIGAGAVFASMLPWLLTRCFGVAAVASAGLLPPSLKLAFAIGAAGLLASVAVTVLTAPERAPAAFRAAAAHVPRADWASTSSAALTRHGLLWIAAGLALAVGTAVTGLRGELYLIAGLGVVLGGGQLATAWSARGGARPTGLLEIIDDVIHMPAVMRRLAVVQFFTWFGFSTLWIYVVPAVAGHAAHGADPDGAVYNSSADWVGLMFAFYNGVAAIGAFALPAIAKRLGRREAHALCLLLGAAGLLGFALVTDRAWLWGPAAAIGCGWASILSAPYAMVSSAVPPERMGVYMGIHNVFIVLPQLVTAAILGVIVDRLFGNRADFALVLAAGSVGVAAALSLTIPDRHRD